jgi:hypothetical protein
MLQRWQDYSMKAIRGFWSGSHDVLKLDQIASHIAETESPTRVGLSGEKGAIA